MEIVPNKPGHKQQLKTKFIIYNMINTENIFNLLCFIQRYSLTLYSLFVLNL